MSGQRSFFASANCAVTSAGYFFNHTLSFNGPFDSLKFCLMTEEEEVCQTFEQNFIGFPKSSINICGIISSVIPFS